MARTTTPSFVCELPLVLVGADERRLLVRLDSARQVYNAVLGEGLQRLRRLRQSRDYQVAQAMPKRTKDEQKARAIAFRALDKQFGLRQYDLEPCGRQIAASWIGEHLDGETIRAIVVRAWGAVKMYQLGVRGQPRFKGKGQFDSVEGKSNTTGLRWCDGTVIWGDDRHQKRLTLRVRLDSADPVVAHAQTCRVKYIRLVRRKLNERNRFFVQLVCAGQPYQKPQHAVGEGVIGIDPGPRTFGLAGADWGAQVDLSTPLNLSHQARRRLQRKIDRQRRANNPGNYLSNGRIRSGKKTWRISHNQRASERRLAEVDRKATAHRKSLHGQLANAVLSRGNDIRVEKNSYKSFQKTFGKAVGRAAPATFVTLLARKAVSAGALVTVIPTSLRLSQICLCGTIARKSLAERVHRCACGITVQRDVFSAYLARFSLSTATPSGVVWRLDAASAQAAFAGAESRLPVASCPISVQRFAAWTRDQSASGHPLRDAHPSPSGGGSERIIGAVGTMAREGRDAVPHGVPSGRDAREPGRARSGCHQNPPDVSVR